MPLAFDSLNHGLVAFGFFNIESDMLLLEQHFFFASDFCAKVTDIAAMSGDDSISESWPAHCIEAPEDIGDLMGAIHGVQYTGFIGETYKKYPFPSAPEGFKQQPDGHQTRAVFEKMIDRFATAATITLHADAEENTVSIGEYRFTADGFHELIQYVWRGGYPKWKDDVRPDYVLQMKSAIEQSNCWLLRGLTL